MQNAEHDDLRLAAKEDYVAILPFEEQVRLAHIFATMPYCFESGEFFEVGKEAGFYAIRYSFASF